MLSCFSGSTSSPVPDSTTALDKSKSSPSPSPSSTSSSSATPQSKKRIEAFAADPASVARFLKGTPGLGKTPVGEFLSRGPVDLYPFTAEVLREYVNTFDFSGAVVVVVVVVTRLLFLSSTLNYMPSHGQDVCFFVFIFRVICCLFAGKDSSFVQALRTFLGHFRLPGEAQSIDRYMVVGVN